MPGATVRHNEVDFETTNWKVSVDDDSDEIHLHHKPTGNGTVISPDRLQSAEVEGDEGIFTELFELYALMGEITDGQRVERLIGGGLEITPDGYLQVSELPDGDWDGVANPMVEALDASGYDIEDIGTSTAQRHRSEESMEPPQFATFEDAETAEIREGGFVYVEDSGRYYYEDGN